MSDILGFVGLNTLSKSFATKLMEQGFELWFYDERPEIAARFTEIGAFKADFFTILTLKSNIIFLSMAELDHAKNSILSKELVIANIQDGTLVIDLSDGNPQETRKLSEKIELKGGRFVDAPLSRNIQNPETDQVMVMVGGSVQDFERVLPYFLCFTTKENIFHMGTQGSGHAMKVVCNLMNAISRWITVEGLAIAVKSGIPSERVLDIVAVGSGRNYVNQEILPKYIQGDIGVIETTNLGDVVQLFQVGVSMGSELKVPMPISYDLQNLYHLLALMRGSDQNANTLVDMYEQWTGVKIKLGE